MPIYRHGKVTIEGFQAEMAKLHNKNTPECWKDVFFLEMKHSRKVHFVPASQITLSTGSAREEFISCNLGTFLYVGEECELITEIMKGKREFLVSTLEYEALFEEKGRGYL